MSTLSECHKVLNEKGEGKCSVPMWCGGMPSGFCDEPAYSNHKGGKYYDNPRTGDRIFLDGSYGGYVPALACPNHGGHKKEEVVNLCTNCNKNISTCDGKPKFGCGKGNDNVYECEQFESISNIHPVFKEILDNFKS